MANVLITGSEGQIGKIFVKKLLSLGHNVFGMDKVNQVNKGIKFFQTDITETKDLNESLDETPLLNIGYQHWNEGRLSVLHLSNYYNNPQEFF